MKKLRLFYPYLWMFLGLVSFNCSAQKKLNSDKMPKNQLGFGAGGGFGGMVSEFCLLEDGQLYEKTAANQYQRLKTIDKKIAKTHFAQLDSLNLRRVIFNQPGDIYYYIAVRHDKMDEHKVLWGKSDRPVRADIQRFYDALLKLLPKGKGLN
ncbi:MAG: hypothetical protein RIS64_3912 [Bacteroidota bacterium]|jgi:hypothetical protein